MVAKADGDHRPVARSSSPPGRRSTTTGKSAALADYIARLVQVLRLPAGPPGPDRRRRLRRSSTASRPERAAELVDSRTASTAFVALPGDVARAAAEAGRPVPRRRRDPRRRSTSPQEFDGRFNDLVAEGAGLDDRHSTRRRLAEPAPTARRRPAPPATALAGLVQLPTGGRAARRAGASPRGVERLLGVVLLFARLGAGRVAPAGSARRSSPARRPSLTVGWDLVARRHARRRAVGVAAAGAAGAWRSASRSAPALALVAGLSRVGDDLVDANVQMLRFVPIIGLQPLLILWLGIGETAKISLIVLGVAFPIYVNTLRRRSAALDPGYARAGRRWSGSAGASCIRRVVLPGALPGFLVGLRMATAVAWLLLVFAEQINATQRPRLPDDPGADVLPDRRHRRLPGHLRRARPALRRRSSGSSSGASSAGSRDDERHARDPSTPPSRWSVRDVRRSFGDREVLRGIDLDAARRASSSPCSAAAARARARCCGPSPASTAAPSGDDRRARRRGRSSSRTRGCCRGRRCSTTSSSASAGRGAAPARARRRSPRSASAATRTTGPRRCRAARPSGPRWPGRSSASRSCCCSTSRSARSTRSPASGCTPWSRSSAPATDPAVLLVTHDVDEAILLADRVLVLTDGAHLARRRRRRRRAPRLRSDARFIALRSRLLARARRRRDRRGRPRAVRRPDSRTPARPAATHQETAMTLDRRADRRPRRHPALRHDRRRDPRRRPAPTSTTTTVAAIRQVWLDRKVVFFPGQHLDPDRAPRLRRPLRRADRGPPGHPRASTTTPRSSRSTTPPPRELYATYGDVSHHEPGHPLAHRRHLREASAARLDPARRRRPAEPAATRCSPTRRPPSTASARRCRRSSRR